MSIFSDGLKTYDYHEAIVGKSIDNQAILLPIFHDLQKTQIEITLDSHGKFKDAVSSERKVIIPVTSESASRTGTLAHPLTDKLSYLTSFDEQKYNSYIETLGKWKSSSFGHPKLDAVYAYIISGKLLMDLETAGIIKRSEKTNKLKKPDGDKFVRWRVLGCGDQSACWEDQILFDLFISYQRYCIEKEYTNPSFCMISGRCELREIKHIRGLFSRQNGAKLVSAKEGDKIVYTGRFTNESQACTVGYETSQKAHLALRWVIEDQGVSQESKVFVCWSPHCEQKIKNVLPFGNFFEEFQAPKLKDYKENLSKALYGYKKINDENVVIAIFDAATTGRLSLTYYNVLQGSDFLDRLKQWYLTCQWWFGRGSICSPNLYEIIRFAFGREKKEKGEMVVDINWSHYRDTIQQLFLTIIEGRRIPENIVRALAQRASMPLAYQRKKERNNYEKLLSIACAVISKDQNNRKNKEEYRMALEPDKKDRSYQFGRLLAVYEKVEKSTYDKEEERETNAIRMQSIFSERPLNAARIIEESLVPYFQKMNPGQRSYYKKLIGEIWDILAQYNNTDLKRRLEDTYLLGYYLQRQSFYKNNKKQTEEEKNNG